MKNLKNKLIAWLNKYPTNSTGPGCEKTLNPDITMKISDMCRIDRLEREKAKQDAN